MNISEFNHNPEELMNNLRKTVEYSYVPLVLTSLNDYLVEHAKNIRTPSQYENYISNIKKIQEIIFGIDLNKSFEVTPKFEIKKECKLQVQYNGPYQSFSQVVGDFMNQSNTGPKALSDLVKVSTSTITSFLKNKNENPSTSRRRRNGLGQTRTKILNAFEISPPEKLEEILTLDFFHEWWEKKLIVYITSIYSVFLFFCIKHDLNSFLYIQYISKENSFSI